MKTSELESFISQVMGEYRAVGTAARVFSSDDVLFERFMGYRCEERGLPINGDTIFGMASISKSFTALSVMMLAERGRLALTDPVRKHLPSFEDERVQIWHLLTHSAGYYPMKRILVRDVAEPLGLFDGGERELGGDERLAEEGLHLVVSRMNAQRDRIAEPGLLMSYSNDSYGLLSEIIHLTSGERSYADFVRKNIFEPMGMTRSYVEFIRPSRDENGTDLHIYRQGLDGPRETSRDFYDNAFVLMGGGAVKSTPNDIMKYIRMYMSGGMIPGTAERLVSHETILKMTLPRVEYRLGQWYGFGLSMRQIGGLTTWGHGGSLTGVSNFMIWEPRLGIGALVFANTSDVPSSAIAVKAMRAAVDMPLDEPELPERPWSADLIRRAAGYYESGEGATVELIPEGSGIKLIVRGKETACRMIMPGVLEIHPPLTKDDIIAIQDGSGRVYAMRMGGRIIPRAR